MLKYLINIANKVKHFLMLCGGIFSLSAHIFVVAIIIKIAADLLIFASIPTMVANAIFALSCIQLFITPSILRFIERKTKTNLSTYVWYVMIASLGYVLGQIPNALAATSAISLILPILSVTLFAAAYKIARIIVPAIARVISFCMSGFTNSEASLSSEIETFGKLQTPGYAIGSYVVEMLLTKPITAVRNGFNASIENILSVIATTQEICLELYTQLRNNFPGFRPIPPRIDFIGLNPFIVKENNHASALKLDYTTHRYNFPNTTFNVKLSETEQTILKQKLQEHDQEATKYFCSISKQISRDPVYVTLRDGSNRYFDRPNLLQHLSMNLHIPGTRQQLASLYEIVSDDAAKQIIMDTIRDQILPYRAQAGRYSPTFLPSNNTGAAATSNNTGAAAASNTISPLRARRASFDTHSGREKRASELGVRPLF